MVIDVDVYGEIRRMALDGISQRTIARRLGISRNTVKKYCDGNAKPWERKPYQREAAVMTEEAKAFIKSCLDYDRENGTKKQHHTAKRIYDRMVEEKGFTGGESTVRRIVRELREESARNEAFIPLSFAPASAAQVDWGEATVEIGGIRQKVNIFCGRLCYSCLPFAIAYRRQNEQCFQDAFVHMFEYFQGVPRQIIFDNARVAVKEGFGKLAVIQEGYNRLSSHYGFQAVFCNPASGNEKGLVENLVGYIRRNVCVPIPSVADMDELNAMLLSKCQDYAERHRISGRTESVGKMFLTEKQELLPLPGSCFEAADIIPSVIVGKYSTVRYETNSYSVPTDYVGKTVTVKAGPEKIRILRENNVVAEHTRCYSKRKSIYRIEHYLKLLERKSRAIPFAKPVTETIPESFLHWLQIQALSPRQMVELLIYCRDHGAEAAVHYKRQLTVIHPLDMQDPVREKQVDLAQYDTLFEAKEYAEG